ncbi:MAG: glycoside hydrolase family 5 protein [Hyphomicrobium sp.]|jgi:endoglucanase
MPVLSRRALVASGAAAAVSGPVAWPAFDAGLPAALRYTGINLAGGEFGALPGVYGREYLFPSVDNARYYARLGFNLVRLPFKWERLQPELGGEFERGDRDRLVELVQSLTAQDLYVVIDPHNYAKRRLADDKWGTENLIGSREVPSAAFAGFWGRLAGLFAGNGRVFLGLMNEPAGIGAEAWLEIANEAIAAIREAGARNLILVPGVAYTGAHSWLASGNAKMAGVRDPQGHFVFELHQYFDRDSSGTRDEAVSSTIGSERIRGFQAWAKTNGFKAFLGEFNGGRNATGLAALDDICREMASHPDVWIGWAAWAGGPRWPPDDMFNLEPAGGVDPREQTRVLARFAQKGIAFSK